jgi:hypothetical protein
MRYQSVGEVIDDLEARAVAAGRQISLGDGHAHAVAKSLAERAGGGFHAWANAAFWMTGSHATPLSKLFDLFQR